jgi:hypothetical protein
MTVTGTQLCSEARYLYGRVSIVRGKRERGHLELPKKIERYATPQRKIVYNVYDFINNSTYTVCIYLHYKNQKASC